MSEAVSFAIENTRRIVKDKNEVIDVLLTLPLSESLREQIAAWKRKALDEIGSDVTRTLIEALQRELPEKYRFLLDPVEKLDDKTLDAIDWSKKSRARAPVTIEAASSMAIELDGVLDDQLKRVLRLPLPADSVLLTASVAGRIVIDANAGGRASFASLSAQASSEHDRILTTGFVRRKGRPVLLDLLDLRAYFINPADLKCVMASFAANPSHRLLQHQYHGTVVFGMQVGIEHSLDKALRELHSHADLTPSAAGGASLTVKLKDRDTFVLTVERDTASSAFVKLEKKQTQERSRVFKLGATIELVGLKDHLVNRIGALLPEDDRVSVAIAKLEALIDQADGEGLKALIRHSLHEKWPGRRTAFDRLLGYKPTDEVAEALIEELTERITEKVNDRVNVLSDDAADKGRMIAREIALELGLDSPTSAGLQDYVQAGVGDALQKLRNKLEQKIESTSREASDKLVDMLEPFGDLDARIQEALDALADPAAEALGRIKAGIEALYGRYTGFRQKLIRAVKERVSEQAAQAIVSESSRSRTDTTMIAFRIRDANVECVDELYRAIWSGRLDDIGRLLPTARDNLGIVELEGSYISVLANEERTALSLNLFGLKLSSEVLFSNEVRVGLDHRGVLIVARSDAEYRSRRRLVGETQNLSAEWSIDYLAADAGLVPPITIRIEVGDQSFTRSDLNAFLAGLSKLGCVKADSYATIAGDLFGDVGSDKKLTDITLSLVVTLRWEMLLAIFGADRDGTERRDRWDAYEIVQALYDAARTAKGARFFGSLERAANHQDVAPESLLLLIGEKTGAQLRRENAARWAVGNHAIGHAMSTFCDHLERLQAQWLAFMRELRVSSIDTDTKEAYGASIDAIDAELRAVLAAMFLRSTVPTVPDLSNVWRLAAGMRVLLDRAGHDHVTVSIEGPKIGRRIYG